VPDPHAYGNGIAGVAIHVHLPGLHMAGNEVLGNNIGRNNMVGDTIGLAPPASSNPDLRTTGILVGSSTHIGVVISGNHIHHDYYSIYIDSLVRATFGGKPLPPGAHTGQVHLSIAGSGAGAGPGRWRLARAFARGAVGPSSSRRALGWPDEPSRRRRYSRRTLRS